MKIKPILKNEKLNILLKKLNELKQFNQEGQLTFPVFEHDRLIWAFSSSLDFGENISSTLKQIILNKASNRAAKENILDQDIFLDYLENERKKISALTPKTYFVLLSISIKSLPVRKLSINNSEVNFCGRSFPKKFRADRGLQFKRWFNKNEDEDYLKVSIKVKSRNIHDAYENAKNDFEIVRAMLCLALNSSSEISFSTASSKPINKIVFGEFFSIHNEDGTIADNNISWLSADFKKRKCLELDTIKHNSIRSYLRKTLDKFKQCHAKHRCTLAKALKLYVNAFDALDKHVCFVKSWPVLEVLANTDDNNLIIRRCLALITGPNKKYEEIRLEGLRNFRNEYVHKGTGIANPQTACYEIQNIIFNLFRFNLAYAGKFNNIEQINQFLDMTNREFHNIKTLQKIIRHVIPFKERQKPS